MCSLDKRLTSLNGPRLRQPCAKASSVLAGSRPLSSPVRTQSSAGTLPALLQPGTRGRSGCSAIRLTKWLASRLQFSIPSDRQVEELTILERINRGARIENYETIRLRKDGSLVNVSLTISPVRNAEGKIVGASKIARDITRRKRAESREKILMAELDHRVKNALASVAMIATSSRHDGSSIDEFARTLDGRIHSMAAVHMLLKSKESAWCRTCGSRS